MRRDEKSKKLKIEICNAARDLFITQGYKMTTVRQIITEADIQTGTLYHFFKDKEDIFLHIVVNNFDKAMLLADNLLGKKADPLFKYALIAGLEIKAIEKYQQIAELYFESYSSWRISHVMLEYKTRRNMELFRKYNPEFTDMDYYLKGLAIRGMRFYFIQERIHSGTLDFKIKCPFIIRTELGGLNIPENEIGPAIDFTMKSLKKDRVNLRGFVL